MQNSTCILMLSFVKHTFITTLFDRTSVFYLFSYPICNLFLTKKLMYFLSLTNDDALKTSDLGDFVS